MRELIRLAAVAGFVIVVSPAPVAGQPGAGQPVAAAPDSPVTLTLGPISVSSYNPVTVTPFERSTVLYFAARNNGTTAATLRFTSYDEIVAHRPSWMLHFFKFFGSIYQPSSDFKLQPGETQTLSFYLSIDAPGLDAVLAPVDLPFRFQVLDTGPEGALTISIRPNNNTRQFFFQTAQSGLVSGRVTAADGTPIQDAKITIGHLSENDGLFRARTTTDANGQYQSTVFSIDEVKTAMGPRALPYRSLGYFLYVEKDGYALAYQGGLEPPARQPLVVDVRLEPLTTRPTYTLVGELATEGLLSYWWIRFAGDRIISVQGQHPPAIGKAGHVIAVDLNGKELWRVVTGDECWGLDVSADGSRVAAGCHDGYVYLVDSGDGRLIQKVKTGDRRLLSGYANDPRNIPAVLDIRFSPDGTSLLVDGTAGGGGCSILDGRTGTSLVKVAAQGLDQPSVYRGRWSPDGRRFVTGDDLITVRDSSGRQLWSNTIGVSPTGVEIDHAYNVYAVGKSRTIVSWDKDGRERWRYHAGTTGNFGGRGLTADGGLMVLKGQDGYLHAVDSQGRVLWRRFTHTKGMVPAGCSSTGTGHNGLWVSPTADLIAVAGRCYDVLVYDRTGALLWSHKASPRPDFKGDNPLNHGNYDGTISITVSPDGRYIAAGYADSVIRIFALSAGSAAPSGLTATALGSSVAR